MITKDQLKQILEIQSRLVLPKKVISREQKIPKTSRVVIITGIRRCGKSTLLKQTMKAYATYGYLNLEDPRLEGFDVKDFHKFEEILASQKKNKYLFFDEIQNIPGWERFIRTMHDQDKNLILTGSNSSMLSKELGTKLTGRYKSIELFPFSYREYLAYSDSTPSRDSFMRYMELGGFPEYLKEKDPSYLQELLKDIIVRDILVRKGLKNESLLTELALYLISNVGKEFSFNKVSKILGIKSVRSTIDYCKFLQDSYLIELVPNYSKSIKKQIINPKKAYAVDTGLINSNTLSFSEDLGRMFENSVFMELRRRYRDIYYFKEENECDFLIKEKDGISLAVQACFDLNDNNLKREIEGLRSAVNKTRAKGIIITLDQEDVIDNVSLVPAWKYFS
ncbi:MAG: ATP-binding protein [Nanobdellota archaeon]